MASNKQPTPLGFPATPTVLLAMKTCDSNNTSKRPQTPGNTSTADWCSIYPFCNMQDPNAEQISSPGRGTTIMPPNDITGKKTYSDIYSSTAYCDTSCQGLNDAYLVDFKKTCPDGTSAIRDNNSKHNNPDAIEPGEYNPLYFDKTQCVQTQFICAQNKLKPDNKGGYILPSPNTTLLPPGQGASKLEINCNRIPGYIFSNGECIINSSQTPPKNATDPKASPGSNNACPELPVSPTSESLGSIAEGMGMNQSCDQDETDTQAAGEVSASVNSGFGPKASANASFLANAHHQKTSGCAQRTAQVSSFNSNKNAVACSMVNIDNNTYMNTSEVQNISLNAMGPSQSMVNLVQNLNQTCIQMEGQLGLKGLNSLIPFCSKDSISKLYEELSSNITINNAKITNEMRNTGKVQAKTNSDNIQNTAATFVNTVKQATSATLQNMIGSNALPLNTNQLIDQKVLDNQNIINDAITQISQSASLSNQSGQSITMNTTGNIDIENTTIDNNMINNLSASSMVKSATRIGQQIASSIAADMDNTTTNKNTIAGEDAVINALGKANTDAIGELAKIDAGSWNNLYIAIAVIVGIIVIGGGIFGVIKMSGSKKSSIPVGGDSSVKSGDSSVKSGDSSVKSSAFKFKKSNMQGIKNEGIDYSFIANISLAFCIFILCMFLICEKK